MELIITVLLFIVGYWILKALFRGFIIAQRFKSVKNEFERRAREAQNQGTTQKNEEEKSKTNEKLELEDMVKRKFDKDQGEYVDFEDVKE